MKNLIQFIKRLWYKWKYRNYFNSAKTEAELYKELEEKIRAARKAYQEFQDKVNMESFYAEIPIGMMDMVIPPLPNVKEIENTDHFNAPVIVKEIHCKWDEDGEWE